LLSESNRVFDALQRSFAGNQRNVHVAMQLARLMEERSELANAQDVLIKALEANRGNTRLHYAYGEFLFRNKLGSDMDLEYHFRHAYTPGDDNYKAQLLHGRQLFVMGDFEGSSEVFKQLRKAKLPPNIKRTQMHPLDRDYTGTIDQVEAYYCDIRCDGAGGTVRLDFEDLESRIDRGDFAKYTRVTFRIAFSMFGPRAFDLRI
jgi:Tfp pilus assembly protein PilF